MTVAMRLAALGAAMALPAGPAFAQMTVWAVEAEQLEYRLGEGGTDVIAWDTDAYWGTDELKVRWISEGAYVFEEDAFEELENHLRVQTPISDFWDVVAGVRVDTPDGPDRVYGVIGVHGLAPQWVEVDADLYVSGGPVFEVDAEYEGLITNRLILTPSIEMELPLTDDEEIGNGAFGPTIEVGARLSYDLVDRLLSPYIGVHYERAFGESADLVRADGEDAGALYFVAGAKILF
jgi:copper resistance protein B